MESESSLPHSHEPTYLSLSWGRSVQSMTPSNVLKISFNIIIPSTSSCPKSSLSVRFLHQNSVGTSFLAHTFYIPPQSHCSWYDHQNNIWWGVRVIKLLRLRHLQPMLVLQCERRSLTPIQNNRKSYSYVYYNLFIFEYHSLISVWS